MSQLLCVGVGGFLGSIARYLLGSWAQRIANNHWFPFGTLSVNSLGCLLIGLLAGYFSTGKLDSENWRLFLITGVLGGFTTFSAFSFETLYLFRSMHQMGALLNILLNVTVSLLAVTAGYCLSKGA